LTPTLTKSYPPLTSRRKKTMTLPNNTLLGNHAPTRNVLYFKGSDGMEPSLKYPNFPINFIGRLRIDATKGVTTRTGDRAFIAELSVLSSNLPDTVRVGGKYSWYQSLKEPGTAYPSCIAFLYAALGLDSVKHAAYIAKEIKPNQDTWLNKAANENCLAGSEVHLQTSLKRKKGFAPSQVPMHDKGDFTLHTFAPTAEALSEADAMAAQ